MGARAGGAGAPKAREDHENLIANGATHEEADFISNGQRVELNMFTSADVVAFVEGKLQEHGVEKVIPEDDTLAEAWKRAHRAITVNAFIRHTPGDNDAPAPDLDTEIPPTPDDLRERIRRAF